MQLATHGLGCSIKALSGMTTNMFNIDPNSIGGKTVDVYSKTGVTALKNALQKGMAGFRGGLCIWADTSTRQNAEHNGLKFYEYLKSIGENVSRTRPYKNPGHDGECRLFMWFFNGDSKPAKVVGRQAEKTPVRRVAVRSSARR